MANEVLKFRKGQYSKLPTTKVAGTVYVTTDEKAMYVDISNTERIRLGQIIEVKNLTEWAALKPPFSPEAFYYINDDNALIKYTGDNVNTHTWKQINSTSDIEKAIDDLEKDLGLVSGRVGALEGSLGQATSDPDGTGTVYERLDNIRDTATAASTLAGQNETDLRALEQRVTTNEGDIDKLEKRATDLETGLGLANANIGTNATDIDNLEVRMGTAETNITNLRTDLGTNDKTGTTAFGRIASLENELDAATVGVKARLTAVEQKATDNATNIGLNSVAIQQNKEAIESNDADILALQKAIGDGTGLTARIETLEGEMDTAQGDITTMKGQISAHDQTLSDHTTTLGTLNTFKGATEEALGNINTALDGHDDRIEALEGRATNIEAAASALTQRVTNVEQKAANNAAAITELQTTTGNHSNQIADLQETKADKTALQQAVTDLQTEIDNEIRAANAMNYIGSIETVNELPYGTEQKWTSAKIGDTFVLSQTSGNYHAGDLLVAYSDTGVEQADGTIGATNIRWNHVKTGYIADHNPIMSLEDGNAINLTSFTGVVGSGDLGSISITADAATSATVTANEAGTGLVVGMAWEDFT